MLTSATKRKIDNARDILVGKIPMPTTQVEQITLALIYKFMSDIDKKSKALGDTSGFFANGYEKYAWDNLMDKSLPARDRVTLYSEGLEKMSKNPHIPQLFRDIFKNAFLPFRSPETLKLFLEQIDEFQYDHSEELGNAFEYLLSAMGSQGDAGQFRTPRHIIDFLVKVVDPSKTDTILDPACGTAGFLISAYKHIREKGLTAEEQKKLTDNFVGYDISHDMQRLAMVNMYLHHFPDPKIFEYDTLSSEDRWDDDFDVILANPPFMTPKGGIKPHSRFAIKSKRSEVLFVDYIMEHLNNNGKAGIIVPEGIIFQSQNAYKDMRRMMIENHFLWAVASLPSGIFNPYSGVKTSILFFDKEIAKKTNKVMFCNVENTGISLGATNAVISENDLPTAMADLIEFKNSGNSNSSNSFVVDKGEIKEKGWDLSLSKYKISVGNDKTIKYMPLKDIAHLNKGKSSSTKTLPGDYKLFLTAEEQKTADHYDFDTDGVAVPLISALGHGKADIKRVHRVSGKVAIANLLCLIEPDKDLINPDYLYYILDSKKKEMAGLMTGSANVSMKVSDLESFVIPVPSIQSQIELVEELNRYREIIDGVNQVVDNYRPSFKINNNWEWKKIGDFCELSQGFAVNSTTSHALKDDGDLPLLRIKDFIKNNFEQKVDSKLVPRATIITYEDLVYSRTGQVGLVFTGRIGVLHNNLFKIDFDKRVVIKEYLFYVLQIPAIKEQVIELSKRSAQPDLTHTAFKSISLPTPTIEIQKKIVDELNKENDLVLGTKKLKEIYKVKIKNKIDEIWSR